MNKIIGIIFILLLMRSLVIIPSNVVGEIVSGVENDIQVITLSDGSKVYTISPVVNVQEVSKPSEITTVKAIEVYNGKLYLYGTTDTYVAVYVSYDGLSWTQLLKLDGYNATIGNKMFYIASDGTIFFCARNTTGPYIFRYDGTTVKAVLQLEFWRMTEDNNGNLYVANYGSFYKDALIYKSSDDGNTWTLLLNMTQYFSEDTDHVHGLYVDKYTNRLWIAPDVNSTASWHFLVYTDDYVTFHVLWNHTRAYSVAPLDFVATQRYVIIGMDAYRELAIYDKITKSCYRVTTYKNISGFIFGDSPGWDFAEEYNGKIYFTSTTVVTGYNPAIWILVPRDDVDPYYWTIVPIIWTLTNQTQFSGFKWITTQPFNDWWYVTDGKHIIRFRDLSFEDIYFIEKYLYEYKEIGEQSFTIAFTMLEGTEKEIVFSSPVNVTVSVENIFYNTTNINYYDFEDTAYGVEDNSTAYTGNYSAKIVNDGSADVTIALDMKTHNPPINATRDYIAVAYKYKVVVYDHQEEQGKATANIIVDLSYTDETITNYYTTISPPFESKVNLTQFTYVFNYRPISKDVNGTRIRLVSYARNEVAWFDSISVYGIKKEDAIYLLKTFGRLPIYSTDPSVYGKLIINGTVVTGQKTYTNVKVLRIKVPEGAGVTKITITGTRSLKTNIPLKYNKGIWYYDKVLRKDYNIVFNWYNDKILTLIPLYLISQPDAGRGIVKHASYNYPKIDITIWAPSGTTITLMVYTPLEPKQVYAYYERLPEVVSKAKLDSAGFDCWYYDSANKLLYIKVTAHSDVPVQVYYSAMGGELQPVSLPIEYIMTILVIAVLLIGFLVRKIKH